MSRKTITWLGLLVLPLATWGLMQADTSFLHSRLRLHGRPIAQDALPQQLRKLAQHYGSARLLIHVGPYVVRASHRLLGATLNVEGTLSEVRKLGRSGNPFRDLGLLLAAVLEPLEVQLQPVTDRTELQRAVALLRTTLERPAVAGTFNEDGQPVAGEPGLTINAVHAVARLEAALLAGKSHVHLAMTTLPAPAPVVYNGRNDALELNVALGRYRTKYKQRGKSAGRARNVELAARLLDGVVVAPGAVLSFNDTVGARAEGRGFAGAKEILRGRVVDGVGGGVCQVAATLHATAFLAGFDIPEYRPHSRPTRYIPLGLDTMVAWNQSDLKLRNPYPFPVRIRASAEDGVVEVYLFGRGPPHPVEWRADILQTYPSTTQREPDANLPSGVEQVVQRPVDGLRIRRTRTIYRPGGSTTSAPVFEYPPTPQIIAYGP